MAKDLNKWAGIGRCCADIELKYLPSGGAVCNVNLACNNSYKDKNTGQIIEDTEFVRLAFFNRTAEIAGEYLSKGSKIYVEGPLKTRTWDKDGVKQYKTEIVVSYMQMLDSRGSQPQGGQQPAQQQSQQQSQPAQNQQQPQQSAPNGSDDFEDDIPF